MGFLIFAGLLAFAYFQGMPEPQLWILAKLCVLAYFVGRLLANLIFDADRDAASRENTRKHFGRPSFSARVDKNGKLHIKSGENPDHATRCQRSLNDWYRIENRLKWNNWIYGGVILAVGFTL